MNPTQAGSFTTPVSNALKATIQHHDSAVIIHARGEIDAANEHTWQDLVTKAAAATTAPEPLVVNLNGLDFMGCCAVAVLAHEAERCRRRGVDVRLVSRDRAVARNHPRLRIRRRAARTPDHGVRAVSDISGGLPQTHFCFSGKLVGHVDNLVALPGELVCAR